MTKPPEDVNVKRLPKLQNSFDGLHLKYRAHHVIRRRCPNALTYFAKLRTWSFRARTEARYNNQRPNRRNVRH